MNEIKLYNNAIQGHKKEAAAGPSDDPNTLRSKSFARVQDLLGWGEWQGLVNGGQGILINQTPLIGADGVTANFDGVSYAVSPGTQTQSYMSGFDTAEDFNSVGVRVPSGQPIIREVTNPDADTVVVSTRIPQLYQQNSTTGAITSAQLDFTISLSLNGGAYKVVKTVSYYGKCTTDYIEGFALTLPKSATPESDYWQIKIDRVTPDHYGDAFIHDDFYFESWSDVITQKFTFPNCFMVGIEIDAQSLSQIPTRSYHVQMMKVQVPKNYDPVARTYATTGPGTTNGGWDGTFKIAYTNNPAWVWFDLATNKQIGIGLSIQAADVNKWRLYDIAQYCDRMVPDGKGGTEPLFTCNFYLQVQNDALSVLNDVASNFRAMLYYYGGQIIPVQDKPVFSTGYFAQFTNANVVGGQFNYTSTAKKSRKTVAYVAFSDPDNYYQIAYQPVEDYLGIQRYGFQDITVSAFGCTSRAQAYRYGQNILQTEAKEYDVVTFQTGLEATALQVGDIIQIADRDRAQVAYGGRVNLNTGAVSTTSVPLDRPVVIEAGKTYKLSVTVPKAFAEAEDITDSTQTPALRYSQLETQTITNGPGSTSTLTLASPLTRAPDGGAVWVVTASDLAPAPFRVLRVTELEGNVYEISANRYDVTKYTEVEVDPNFTSPPIVRFPQDGVVAPVSNLTVALRNVTNPNGVQLFLDVGWTNNDPYVNKYRVSYSVDGGQYLEMPLTSQLSVSIPAVQNGAYIILVYAIRGLLGQTSAPTEVDYNVTDSSYHSPFTVTGLELKDKGNINVFEGKDAKFVWRVNSPGQATDFGDEPNGAVEDGTQDPRFSRFLVQIYNSANNTLVFQDYTTNTFYDYTYEKNSEAMNGGDPLRAFTIYVIAVDKYNGRSNPAVLSVSNPAPSIPDTQYTEHYGMVEFRFVAPRDTDFVGFLIWIDTANPIIVSAANLKYDGQDTNVLVPLAIGQSYQVRVAGYDVFGKIGLNYSTQFTVTPLSVIDTDPPAVPTGVTLSTTVTNQPDGTQQIKLIATWNANTEGDFASYSWRINKSGGSPFAWVYGTTTTKTATTVSFIVDPNVSYDFQVNAVDTSGNVSNWSNVVALTSGKDTTIPAAPTWGEADVFFRTVYLTWNKAPESDFSHWELWSSPTNSIGSATIESNNLTSNVTTINMPATGLQTGQSLYFWLYAVDTSGNKSLVSASIAATMSGVPTPTGLTVSSVVETQVDGTQLTYLTASFTAVTYGELANYTWEVSTVSLAGDYYRGTTTAPFLRLLVGGNVTYYVRVCANDSNTGHSQFCTEVSVLAAKDGTPPPVPTGITATSAISSCFLNWTNPTDKDLQSVLIYRNTTAAFPGGSPYATVSGDSNTFVDQNVTVGQIYYYYFKCQDTSGNVTVNPSSPASTTPGSVGASAIGSFALDLTKFYHATVALQNDSWTDNTTTHVVTWNSHTLYYQGAAYTISAGSTSNGYIYWDSASTPTAYHTSTTNPTLTDTQFMIATNVNGAHDLAWNAMANALIGTAYIGDAAVTNAKIQSLTADKITSATITGQQINISGSAAASYIGSSNFVTGTTGFRIYGDGTAEFNSVTVRGNLKGGTIAIGASPTTGTAFYCDASGNIWIGATTFGAAPFSVSNSGVLYAASATITGSTSVASALQVGTLFQLGDSTHATSSSIQSYNWVSNTTGFRVLGNGDAEFNNINARGSITITGGSIGSTSISNIETGTNRALTAINGSYNITTAVAPSFNVAPSGSGLYLGANLMGYYDGGAWKTYMNNSGQMYFIGTGAHSLSWDGTNLSLVGSMTITNGVDYSNVNGTKPPSNADVTLSAINGDLTITAGGLNLSGGRIQSSNFISGSTGWKIDATGAAEFSNITVRGNLAAGAISSGAAVYNPGATNSTFPAVTIQTSATGALTDTSSPIMITTLYGWATGTGYARDRFGRSDALFYVSFSGIVDNYVTLWYRVNSGSWAVMPGSQQAAQSAGYGTIYTGVSFPITLGGTDVIQFGVRGCDNGGTYFDNSKKGVYGVITVLCFNF